MRRQLICISIIHPPEDLGSQMEATRSEYVARYGHETWQEHVAALEKFWREIRNFLFLLPLDSRTVRIYQDGLPVCGRELEIASELAARGSRNYQLVLDLVQKGARLMGTEDPDLLRKEKERWEESAGKIFQSAAEYGYDDLMAGRDRYIADRIHRTLQEGEVGLLFIGALHRVTDKLPADIEMIPVGASITRPGSG